MIALFQKLSTIYRMLVAEILKLVKLILAMPATSAVGERSFWSLKELKLTLVDEFSERRAGRNQN